MLTFLPDSSDTAPEILKSVSAIPTLRGYASPPAGVDMDAAALGADPQGSVLTEKLDGTTRTLTGTSAALFELSGGSWTDRSRAGSPAYSIGTNRWRFVQFGDTTLAINLSTVLQSSTTGAFADVANAPKANLMEAVAGFVILANTDDSGLGIAGGPNAAQANRWWCSQIFNPTGTWAPNVSTQATTGLLVETQGAITGLKRLLNDIVVYKARSIYVGRYVGPSEVWAFQCVSNDIGCASQECIVNAGTTHYFIGDSDIYAFDGSRPIAIGSGIREWFFGRVNRTYLSNIRALHDRANSLIYWFYPTTSQSLTSVLVYHYETKRWGAFDLSVLDVLEAITSTVTYADLGNFFSTYGDIPTTLTYGDSFFAATKPVLSYFSTTRFLTGLTGTAEQASILTGWYGDENTVSLCDRVRPKYRTKPATAAIGPLSVFGLGDTPTIGTSSFNNGDRFDVLQEARYHQFLFIFVGAMEIEAVLPRLIPEGEE